MKILILVWTSILISSFLYQVLKRKEEKIKNGFIGYCAWISDQLDEMGYRASLRGIAVILLSSMILGSGFACFLPDILSQMAARSTIDTAARLNREGKYVEAGQVLKEYIGASSPLIQNELGIAYMGQGNYELAEQAFRKAHKLLPDYDKPIRNLRILRDLTHSRSETDFFDGKRAADAKKIDVDSEKVYGLKKREGVFHSILRIFLIVLFSVLILFAPKCLVRFLRWYRKKRFERMFSGALIMISNCLKAGLTLEMALKTVSTETQPPVSREFEITMNEINLGLSIDDALKKFAERMPTTDNRIFVNSILILRETGGNLPKVFDTLAGTIRERDRIRGKIDAVTAEGRVQCLVLAVMPFVMALIFHKLTPETFRLMYTTVPGWLMIIGALIMETIGLFWMFRIVRVKI